MFLNLPKLFSCLSFAAMFLNLPQLLNYPHRHNSMDLCVRQSCGPAMVLTLP